MAFHIDTKGIPTLDSYKRASDWEAQVKPVRGDANNTKPLGPRNKKHINIRREDDDIKVRLYRTDVVTYKSNGEIVLDQGGYPTQSTVQLLYAVLPDGPRPHLFKGAVWVWGDYVEVDENNNSVTHTGYFRIGRTATIELNPVTRNYRIYNPAPVYTHHIDRKNKRVATKEYASFLAYVKGITAVRAEDGEIVLGEGERAPYLHSQDLDGKMRGDDPADHYDAFLSVANWGRYYNWRTGTSRTCCRVSSIKRAIDKHIIRQNSDRILVKTQAKWGVQVDDKYKAYV
jgi:hypothetical protein